MLRQKPNNWFVRGDATPLRIPDADCLQPAFTVTSAPAGGAVLKADGTQVRLGEPLTAAEIAGLRFAPQSGEASPWNGFVIPVPRNSGRVPIALLASIPPGSAADTPVAITELPSNGSVFLADGMTTVARGQAISAAQFCGLMFRPAADAVGQISLLRYCSSDQTFMGEVLLVVVPDVCPRDIGETDGARDNNDSFVPIAAALLLEAGLSSLSSTTASATINPEDLLPGETAAPTGAAAATDRPIFDQAAAPALSAAPALDHGVVPASAMLAHLAAEGTGTTNDQSDEPRHHRIGSSTPPDSGSLRLTPSPSNGLVTSYFDSGFIKAGPLTGEIKGNLGSTGSIEIANNAVVEIGHGSFSGRTISFATGSGELILDHSSQFGGLIKSSAAPLSPNDLVDLKDLPFTSSMSATVHYDGGANISTVDFSNGSKTVTLQFAGQDLNWIFKADGSGGTIVADPPVTNPIVLENQKQGTPQSVWQIDPGQDSDLIQGFTTAISTNIGGTVSFKIDNQTSGANYHIDIYRLGYYGGDGARLVTTIQHNAASAVHQPAPLTDPSTGLVDAGNWSVTDSWSVPTDAVSGVYVANVIDGTQVFQIPFIIRNDASHSDIVFQTSDETWQAYNSWGGSNLYGGNGPGYGGAAYAVSYNRPIITRDGGLQGNANDMLFSAEYPAIYWLEENGYDVSYISGIDTATNGALLLNHKVYMDVGHDEYWTDSQRANVQAAGRAGVNLMFLSGNEVYWQTRLAPSIDPSDTANRTLITYKDTHANAVIDPTGTATGTFMDARFASSGGMSGIPSNSLTGTVFQADDPAYGTITIPYGQTQLRIWSNTPISHTASGQTASLTPNLLGYEWDASPDNGFRPAGLVDLSSTTLQINTKLLDYGNTVGSGTATHNLVEFRDPVSGALVFGAGTVFWSWGLASDHDQVGIATQTPTDPNVQQAMVNLFADMGVQPETLQASLVIAAQSSDHTAPTSTITNISATNVVEGQSVTVSGTASDVGGVIGGVEVSADGGKTWHPATGSVGTANVSWSYTFNAGAPGTVNIESRAVDDSINLETPGAGVPLTIKPSSNLTIFSPTDTPAVVTNSDTNSVELGVKFVSSVVGEITGIRFYKGPQNTGTHLGDLWTSTGTLLASATFTNETASGWQQVNFATPVQIQPGVTYIASYHTNVGEYSTTDYYFDSSGRSNGALTATGSGLNGVFAYGPGPIYPGTVSISGGNNFWVDVVFNDTSLSPQANNDSGFSVTENGTLTIQASALLANDTDPSGLGFSITSVGNAVNGAVAYDAVAKMVTFTPAANYAGPANFTYTITDTSGASGSGQVSLNVNFPVTSQSLFGSSATPSLLNSGDAVPVELGVKFTASVSGVITGIRFYKGAANTGPHVADLWSSTGTLIATATFGNETASGWQEVDFSDPIAVTAGTTYVASYHTNGNYSANSNYFVNSLTNGELTAPGGANGVYAYGPAGIFPANSFNSSNYWVDVVFDGSDRPIANADSGFVVNENGSITIQASALLANDTDSAGQAISITAVGSASNGAATYDPIAQTVTFTPTAGYTGTASFRYTVADTSGGTASANVGLFVNDPSAESLFSLSSVPGVVTVNDPSSVELGVKFTPTSAGLITGLRFYKGPQNVGTHVADLWSLNGTLLATATFSNETASGWQQVNFSTPFAVTAGTTYIASYHSSGDYSVSAGYFANPLVSGDLTAPAGANGVYAYGTGSTFPGATFNSSNYWVDVVYSKSASPPVANDDSGFVVSENGSITIQASALLANDTDPNGQAISITGAGNATNGGVSYDPIAHTVTFTPTAGYTGTASFTYSIAETSGATASANVSLMVNDPTTESLFALNSVPGVVAVNDPSSVELGVKFTPTASGLITGLRFYKGPQNIGTHVADLWSSNGTLMATATFSNETASGWQQVNFSTPVVVTAGTTYIASYHSSGNYSVSAGYFANPLVSGDLTAPAGTNGVFGYGTGNVFPTGSYNSTNYWVDVVYTKSDPPVANNDSGFVVSENGSITIQSSTLLANDTDPNGQAISITGVSNASNGSVSYDPNAHTVTFTPTTGYAGTASFNYSVAETNNPVASASASVSLIVNDPSIASLFNPATTPSIASVSDTGAIEVGVKFQASTDGTVTGLRFYKGPANTGTHVADLWGSDGTLLATATFSNETASGWQQVNFSAPVAITAGTTYVASYHTNVGEYSADPNAFANAVTNGPLTAPSSSASTGNGVFAYGSSSLFPTNSFNATSYGVDVLFKPQLAAA